MVLGYIFGFLAVLVWGITFVCTKVLLVDFSALEILLFRFLIAYIGLWLMRPKWEKIALKDNIYFALAGLTGVVLYQLTENIALNFTNASNVSIIVSICPLFTAIIAQIFLKEKHITPWFILGFIISIAGIALVTLNGKLAFELNPKGDLLALTAGICWGFYSLFVSIINSRKYDGMCATRRIFFFAVIFMIPLVFLGMHIKNAGAVSDLAKSLYIDLNFDFNKIRFAKLFNTLSLLFLGLIASGFCFYSWNKACRILGTVKISGGIYLIPVVTIIFAAIFLHEKITVMGIIGACLTIAGLFISSKKSTSQQQEQQ